jgi:Tol biopolymer transport system component
MAPLTPGFPLGSFRIEGLLDAGGMGEVYRAHDSKLNRDVALKILPDAFAIDGDRIARFRREAQVLASLNHPNIAAIYGFEDSGSTHALVLELVEGPTLADRIAQGPIPLDEALPIAKQIAEALEAAHEQGIIHRDLKPANIKVRDDGTVKVLDFGLAKAMEPASAISPALTASPTITTPAMMTGVGMILGTAAYMSPEQAKGRPADKRSDVWAFGCVLYEMLTGTRTFEGEDIADTLANVLKGQPAWTRLSAVPPQIQLLIKRCLEKDRRARISDVAVARFLLTESVAPHEIPGAAAPQLRRRQFAAYAAILFAAVSLTATGAWSIATLREQSPQPVHFAIVPPSAQPLAIQGFDRDVTISSDGRQIVYRVGGQGASENIQLGVRSLDQLDARLLAGITVSRTPFLSPDGRWIAMFEGTGGVLKRVSILGGPQITICQYRGAPRGADWGADDTIIFATNDTTTGLLSVPAGGGEPKVLTKPDATRNEADHVFPSILPGGNGVLFTVIAQGQPLENSQVAVLDVKTGSWKTLIRGGSDARYVETGHLVYAFAGTLRAVRFDLKHLEVTGDPVPVVERVMTSVDGEANFALAGNGTLVYVPGTAAASGGGGIPRLLTWLNREGQEEPINAPARAYGVPRLSPDGTRIALGVADQENDIWTWDLKRESLTRLTFDPSQDGWPIWSPDGSRIVFASSRNGVSNLFWRAADGTGGDVRLTTSPNVQLPASFSPDGRSLVLRESMPKTGQDLNVVHLDTSWKTGPAEPLVATAYAEEGGEISPDGRWLAYYSNESGQNEVYVRPFPNVNGGRWQVSTGGGTRPGWAKNGRELYYLSNRNLGGNAGVTMWSVPVQTTPTFVPGNPQKLFEGIYFQGLNTRTWDVTADGQRFLMIKTAPATPAEQNSTTTPPSVVVVEHWTEELKQRVPVK